MSRAIPQLNQRSSEVLRQIIDAYLETGEAVGSRTLSRNLGMEISPATIRNVMADLQDSGLLFSPHASAGRIPTDAGLRLFVDGLLEVGHLTETERQTIEVQCAAEGRSVQQTLSEATRVLSGLSNCAGLVVAPKSDSALRHIEFVSLAPGRALVVLVTEDGSVENRVIEVPNGMPASTMVEASNFLSTRMVGKTIEEAQGQITAELELHRRDLDVVTRKLVEAGMATATGDGAEAALIVSGAERLLDDVQAVEDLEHVRSLYDALETKESLIKLLDMARGGEGVQIFIGAENDLFSLAGCSVVVAPYHNSEQQIVGAVGVIGPTRINYARIIPVVDYTAQIVGRLVG
ncbi:MAG: heat-inducible transcriptional repressor HrcA [Rhodospirillaceae bacterium]|jgi:heat-inducible transcriptional repressor|nr:heat-inducible transcriptional repressor HrcA [Rhodospirillaceae bacterium]MBT5943947.1 heat-inducible transcriptional repressor HrcA [Rhodospirillaceae bacterium]MBT6405528.1 heat-inducible transcriptional repressor HrcA [Rhodospirillaceae bacterium]MBT6537007.1 heat-inducible transcriptional repressor HrcA [Rhodospirillaceae bacterium]MBT7362962.1 heat-inducible transcriptional repressor HrcA [Rhodospirillaceae bacterium]